MWLNGKSYCPRSSDFPQCPKEELGKDNARRHSSLIASLSSLTKTVLPYFKYWLKKTRSDHAAAYAKAGKGDLKDRTGVQFINTQWERVE